MEKTDSKLPSIFLVAYVLKFQDDLDDALETYEDLYIYGC